MSIAETTRPHLVTREAAAARIEALEAALRMAVTELELHDAVIVAMRCRAALVPEQDK